MSCQVHYFTVFSIHTDVINVLSVGTAKYLSVPAIVHNQYLHSQYPTILYKVKQQAVHNKIINQNPKIITQYFENKGFTAPFRFYNYISKMYFTKQLILL